ncbi:MAG: histidine phosphatase family protein [Porphyrobacter sp.]|nr:histidine phosphatase family protein [Porphyrobacter sp.]
MEVYCIRHGETEWSLSGQHTGRTDLPLTENGRKLAAELRPAIKGHEFALVLSSPLARAKETCEIVGLGERAEIDPDLSEWDYGDYEGLTPAQIHKTVPGWMVFEDGCPGGELPSDLSRRVDRVISRINAVDGDVALFAHGHVLRVLAARWIGLPAEEGRRFLLDTGTLCILGHYRGERAIRVWNCAPI